MLKPEQLFKLPQDQRVKKSKPKSSKKEFEEFARLVEEKLSKK